MRRIGAGKAGRSELVARKGEGARALWNRTWWTTPAEFDNNLFT